MSLIDPRSRYHEPILLRDDAVGGFALVTGSPHTMTAVAMEDTALWELRRKDLHGLLPRSPGLAQRLRDFILNGEATRYLTERQRLGGDKAERWCRTAMCCLEAHQPVPAATTMTPEHAHMAGAPLAIFLGITLDGIPESSPWSSGRARSIRRSVSP